ncbi:MAG TPA: hypothetical protein VHC96_18810 [Puia sp.]|jgi:hypothetical protein|nr:hypothetical protein [Puia sp.]
MHYQYVVILKKNSEKATDALSFFLCLLSSISFFYHAMRSSSWFLYTAAAVLLVGLIINFIARRMGRTHIRYRYLLLVAALGWMASPFLPWLFVLFVTLAFLEYQTKRPLEIGFDKDRVVINSLIRRRYDWSAFSNVILRDGLLTMDFKDNRLFQKEVVDDEDEDDADEDEFNDYCRARLEETSTV